MNVKQFGDWLKTAVKTTKNPVLLVQAGADVTMADEADIFALAQEAGFARVQFAADRPAASPVGSALAP